MLPAFRNFDKTKYKTWQLVLILAFFPIPPFNFFLQGVESSPLDARELENTIRFERQNGEIRARHHRQRRSGLIDHVISTKEIPQTKLKTPGYIIFRKRLAWQEALQVCEETTGHLATFVKKEDAMSVANDIFEMSEFDEDYDWGRRTAEFGLDRRYWIGLTDILQEGQWQWVGKGACLKYNTMWYPNQPDHVSTDGAPKSGRLQHCVSFWNPAYWKLGADGKKSQKHTFDDLECEHKLYFICEEDPEKMQKIRRALAISNGEPLPPPVPRSSPSTGSQPPGQSSPSSNAPAPAPGQPSDTTHPPPPSDSSAPPPAAAGKTKCEAPVLRRSVQMLATPSTGSQPPGQSPSSSNAPAPGQSSDTTNPPPSDSSSAPPPAAAAAKTKSYAPVLRRSVQMLATPSDMS